MTPRFVPFAAMTDAEQREHLREAALLVACPRCMAPAGAFCTTNVQTLTETIHNVRVPHTHEKPAPRTEENR